MMMGKWRKKAVKRFGKGQRTVERAEAISEKMQEALKLWTAMYDNRAPWLSAEVKSLNLAASIAGELARLTTVEMKSEVSGSKRADFLNQCYQEVMDALRRFTEYGCAKGGMVMKPYVSEGKLKVNFVQADHFYPVSFDSSGRVTEAVFADQLHHEDLIYTRLERHKLTASGYLVTNQAYVSRMAGVLGKEIALDEVPEWAHLAEEVMLENVDRLLIGYFRVPYANAVDTDSPLGVSVFARATELIEEADRQYSRLLWEFESGERALYVSDVAFRRDKFGRAQIPNKRLYRLLGLEQGGDDLFSDWTPELREESILRGLNAILRKIEFNCGLAYGTLSDVDDVDKTAEEVRASKQRSYSMVCDMQKALRQSLVDLVGAMDVLCTLYDLAPQGEYQISFDFDDSTVADRKAEFEEKQQLLSSGILRPWEFRMWYFGESEEQAKAALADSVWNVDTPAAVGTIIN